MQTYHNNTSQLQSHIIATQMVIMDDLASVMDKGTIGNVKAVKGVTRWQETMRI